MPLLVKSGLWTNIEDEILKAAITKYGLNQWSRISSLFPLKTAKQSWAREEDEKLLHMAKIMGQQWRTIAQAVGRTANQCLERYQTSLDEAEFLEHDDGKSPFGTSLDDTRKLQPGELIPNPEMRKAVPDPVNMDEDEREMLNEARARFANSHGKKAKRKARQRQIFDSKRLAAVQKYRDAKAAGIDAKLHFRRKGEMDYNVDIPFEIKPAAGFYNTAEEEARGRREQGMINVVEFQGTKRSLQDGDQNRPKRQKIFQPPQQEDTPQNMREQLKKAIQPKLVRKAAMNLPEPHIDEMELERIAKAGVSDEYQDTKHNLRIDFTTLPKPRNDFEFVIPDEYVEDEPKIDESDRSLKGGGRREINLASEEEQGSQSRRRFHSRPENVAALLKEAQDLTDAAEKLVLEEMAQLNSHDESRYPSMDKYAAPKAPFNFTEYIPEEMAAARVEIAKSLTPPSNCISSDLWSSLRETKFDNLSATSVTKNLVKSSSVSNEKERDLYLNLGEIRAFQIGVSSKIQEAAEAIEQARIKLSSFRDLKDSEIASVASRVDSLVEEVERLEQKEREKQERYKLLKESIER